MSPWDVLRANLGTISDEEWARRDAELAAEKADPNFEPPQVEGLGDSDPFGVDWGWVGPPVEESSETKS